MTEHLNENSSSRKMQTIKTGLKKTAKTVDMWRAQNRCTFLGRAMPLKKSCLKKTPVTVIIKMHWVPNGMKAELDMHAHFL